MGSRRKQKTEKSMIQNLYWKQVFRSPKTKIGLMVVIIFALAAIFAPVLAPHDPLLVDVSIKLKNPSAAYPLGTDQLGRCILSRLLWGSRYSLSYSFTVLLITVCVGVPIGLFAGYVGGKIDSIIMRIIDVFMAMPVFIVALAIAGTVGASGAHLILSLSVVSWAEYARLARALTLQEKNKNYMTALKAGGCGHARIIFRHVLRNILPSVIALATMEIGSIILSIAGFSFIGLGVQAPTPEWGIMLSDSRSYIQTYPRLMFYPGILIMIIVLAFNYLGEGIQNGTAKNDVLKVKRLHVEFQTSHGMVHAVKDVSLEVKRGRIHALVGESGSGKSVTSLTIMNLLAGNGKVISGDVTLNEKSLLKLSGKEKRQLYGDRIGMIFQDPTAALDPLFTVEQLLLEGLRKHRRMSKKQAREAALESLRMMNLRDPEELMKKKPYELSGGMCQRVMIAIAMSMKPDYLIADEPTTALDVTVQKQILEEIYQLSRKENLGVLFITHDLGVVAEIADDVSIMKDGEIVENGTVEEIFYHPQHSYTKKLLDAVL